MKYKGRYKGQISERRKIVKEGYPAWEDLANAILSTLHNLGGNARTGQIKDMSVEWLLGNGMDPSIAAIPFNKVKKEGSRLRYHLGMILTDLKRLGLTENVRLGWWALTKKGQDTKIIDSKDHELVRLIKAQNKVGNRERKKESQRQESARETVPWQEELLDILRRMPADSFERLCQKLMEKSGFREVKVTGKSGDGGIDGHGIIRIGGLISFPVLFQCKRFSGGVGAREVRDFRGAMAGRAEKGLILTTGHFTPDAQKEATRDGVAIIDLIGGDLVVEKIKDLGLGVATRKVETVEVQKDWFRANFSV